jgi:serine/threonine-protein kinase
MSGSSPPSPAGRETPGSSGRRAADGATPSDATVRPRTPGGSGSSARRRNASAELPQPGDRIGSFILEEAIGAGGMGAVYRVLDLKLDRHVALKLLPPEQSADPEAIQRFYQEARAAARLDHENIARVHSIGHDGPHHWIAFEYIEGTNIRQRVAEGGPLSVAEAINYTLQIAGALVHAAERGVVHRDIKPSNIIVTPQGRAKLVDMGLARRFERGGSLDDGLTQSGMTLGTFDYISPEQARDPRDVDVRSDLYSLGCTLFHMLTGRPPFPEGTVLQKLLQHQNEPPPDVREGNPDVPADLAAILQKLMAKDRDRRYQAPEQLARDLLSLAGALGLRSVSPEGLVWLSAERPPAWERHLFWAVPVAALGAIVGLLVWWSEPPGTAGNPPLPATASIPRPGAGPGATPPPPPTEPAPAVASPAPRPTTKDVAPIAREVTVTTGAELASLLAAAPSGTTLVLADDGPYELTPAPLVAPAATGRELTLRAAPGTRPMLKAASAPEASSEDRAVLAFHGGRVVLDGLIIQLDAGSGDGSLLGVYAEGVDLAVRRCLFRTNGARESSTRRAAMRLEAGSAADREDGRPVPSVVEECHFDGGQIALWARGPLDGIFRDCTFGPAAVTVWLDNAASPGPVPARLTLRHVSVLGGEGTVFRLTGTEAVVRLDDSVIAPFRGALGTLVAIDDPVRLDWLGRGNLYARIDTYLQPTTTTADQEPIRRFDAWAGNARHVREVDSTATLAAIWQRPDPAAELARTNPTAAFALEPGAAPGVGVRRGPLGPLPIGPGLLASVARRAETLLSRPAAPSPPPAEVSRGAAESTTETMPQPMAAPEEAPMTVAPEPEPEPPTADVGPSRVPRDPFTGSSLFTGPRRKAADPGVGEPGEVRDERELRRRLRAAEAPDEPIRLAAGAVLEMAALEVSGSGRWVLRGPASGDGPRPRLRLRPGLADAEAPSPWAALFHLATASLELQDIDIELTPDPEARWAAFVLGGGSDLKLVRCTVTLRGDAPLSAIVAVTASGPQRDGAGLASIRAMDCLLRSDADVVDVAAGMRLDLTLENSVLAAAGPVVHGHGSPRGTEAETLKVVLRQVAARMAGGLVRLESTPDEPELPLAEVVGRDSILAASAGGAPLFRVDGQDDLERLRDRIVWEGHAVAYHNIETYRRDQTSQPGSVPIRFDRSDWEVAVGPREDAAVHGDLRFLRPWTDARPLSELLPDDMRLDRNGPARASGPDLDRIPVPGSE